MSPASDPRSLALRARAASRRLASAPAAVRANALLDLAQRLSRSTATLAEANARDLEAGRAAGLSTPLLDRLALTPARIEQMAEGVRQVATLPDPLGAELERTVRPNGITIRKVRVPIGVVAVVFEARPNVTIDCAALCVKSGNAAILRGGKEAIHSNTALGRLAAEAFAAAGLDDAVQVLGTTDRAALAELLQLDDLIHCVIPRGGEGLIRFVAENATIPVIKHYQGICAIYAAASADAAMVERIIVNAKCQRPAVCNAAEQFLVHRAFAQRHLADIGRTLAAQGVQLRACPEARALLDAAGVPAVAATASDFTTEFLDLILAVRVVGSTDEAVAWINEHGSGHSDAIIGADEAEARGFQAGVDSATVYWNASTRFTDGFEFGFGAEIGISTDRLHARGPMGLRELCSYKYVIDGTGQVRA